jgi:hypothetical protein
LRLSGKNGFCYAFGAASYTIVTSPVHSGRFAAAFQVDSAPPESSAESGQARCVQQRVLADEAYYGAWYLVPSVQTNTGNWNLFHFQGGTPGDRLHDLWDVSLVNDTSGNLKLAVLDFLTSSGKSAAMPIPIDSWFHLEFYLRRAADATGEVIVYQDNVEAIHFANVITDDSPWAQWYVGNLATALMPSESIIFVDDVEISNTP